LAEQVIEQFSAVPTFFCHGGVWVKRFPTRIQRIFVVYHSDLSDIQKTVYQEKAGGGMGSGIHGECLEKAGVALA
jgi:hypothetical protein